MATHAAPQPGRVPAPEKPRYGTARSGSRGSGPASGRSGGGTRGGATDAAPAYRCCCQPVCHEICAQDSAIALDNKVEIVFLLVPPLQDVAKGHYARVGLAFVGRKDHLVQSHPTAYASCGALSARSIGPKSHAVAGSE